jgi:hypothetical protein
VRRHVEHPLSEAAKAVERDRVAATTERTTKDTATGEVATHFETPVRWRLRLGRPLDWVG